jgi:hypothetical protein
VVAGDAKRFAPIGEFFRNIGIDAPQMCCVRRSRVSCHKGSSFLIEDWMGSFALRTEADEHRGSNEGDWRYWRKSMADCGK